MQATVDRRANRRRSRYRIRRKISGTSTCPRLAVYRSSKHIYVQAIDDVTETVLASASDLEGALRDELKDLKKREKAAKIGEAIGKKLLDKNETKVVFDRNGYIYHGRVKELAEGARKAGLEF